MLLLLETHITKDSFSESNIKSLKMEQDANGTITVSELGRPRRYITDHDANGKGVFNSSFEEDVGSTVLPGILLYDTFLQTQNPIQMNDGQDLKNMRAAEPHAGL